MTVLVCSLDVMYVYVCTYVPAVYICVGFITGLLIHNMCHGPQRESEKERESKGEKERGWVRERERERESVNLMCRGLMSWS